MHIGWQRLASIKYLQHKVSGKVVAVVGHATDFLLSLDVICELAGLDPKDLPFSRNEPRNLQMLLDEDNESVIELHGWELVDEPAQIERLVPTGVCPTCSLSNMYLALGGCSRSALAAACPLALPPPLGQQQPSLSSRPKMRLLPARVRWVSMVIVGPCTRRVQIL